MKKRFLLTIFLLITLSFIPSKIIAQEENAGDLVLYVSEGCPHCANVENFIEENNLTGEIEVKDMSADHEAAAEYNLKCDKAGIALDERGVPLLFDGEEYIDGDSPIIAYLSGKFNISVDDDTDEGNKRAVLLILGMGVMLAIGSLFLTKKNG